jgi:hypothetical protein
MSLISVLYVIPTSCSQYTGLFSKFIVAFRSFLPSEKVTVFVPEL